MLMVKQQTCCVIIMLHLACLIDLNTPLKQMDINLTLMLVFLNALYKKSTDKQAVQ